MTLGRGGLNIFVNNILEYNDAEGFHSQVIVRLNIFIGMLQNILMQKGLYAPIIQKLNIFDHILECFYTEGLPDLGIGGLNVYFINNTLECINP
jgi:hypothetical protein